MKNNGKPRITYVCPVCGNELPWTLIHSKGKFLRCPFCKEIFKRWEVVKEKE